MTSTVDRFTGAVLRPGDPGCAAAVTGQNLAVVHQPALVVEARDAADLAAAVRYAAAEGPGVAVQSTGHGARRPVGGDTLLLRTAALDAVLVDPGARTATLGAGVPTGRLVEACLPYGLAPVTGSAPTVGVVGMTTGGGMGPLGRALGFAADRVLFLRCAVAAVGSPSPVRGCRRRSWAAPWRPDPRSRTPSVGGTPRGRCSPSGC